MACTTSIGPGALNMVTAAAVPAGPAPAGRHLRQPPPRSGAAAGRGLRRRDGYRQRLLQAGVVLFRPHHPARAAPRRAAARGPGADGSGRVRPGHACDEPGRPGRGVRLSCGVLRAAHAPPAPPDARPGRASRPRCSS
jgi:hypothetical protein